MIFAIQKALNKALGRHSDSLQTVVILGIIAACSAAGMSEGSAGVWHFRSAVFAMLFYQAGYLFMRNIEPVNGLIDKLGVLTTVISAVLIYTGYRVSMANGFVSLIRNEYKDLHLFYISALLSSLGYTLAVMWLCRSGRVVKMLVPMDFVGKKTLPYIAFQVSLLKLFWHFWPDTFGAMLGPYDKILTFIVFFGLMPVAWFVDRCVPKRIPPLERRLFPEKSAC